MTITGYTKKLPFLYIALLIYWCLSITIYHWDLVAATKHCFEEVANRLKIEILVFGYGIKFTGALFLILNLGIKKKALIVCVFHVNDCSELLVLFLSIGERKKIYI